jgi:PhnB protein
MIQPWFIFEDGKGAIDFYQEAFGAEVIHLMEPVSGDFLAKMSLAGSQFWVSGGGAPCPDINNHIRMVVNVSNPDEYLERAIRAGAKLIFPMRLDHGWQSGKVMDPFGHHWEFGQELF